MKILIYSYGVVFSRYMLIGYKCCHRKFPAKLDPWQGSLLKNPMIGMCWNLGESTEITCKTRVVQRS